jgi:rRNA maturation endonuclease Nob1
MKKCIYCKKEVPDESLIDFCESCGLRVWGDRMFNAILQNMKEAKSRGDF